KFTKLYVFTLESNTRNPINTIFVEVLSMESNPILNETEKQQVLKVAQVVNPYWYPFIHGYLNGELSNLELDESDQELDYPEMNLGNFQGCVVAEPFGFKSEYNHNGNKE